MLAIDMLKHPHPVVQSAYGTTLDTAGRCDGQLGTLIETTHRVAAELKHAADGVPDDGTSKVSHMHLLGDIRAGEIHHHSDLLHLRRRRAILPKIKLVQT